MRGLRRPDLWFEEIPWRREEEKTAKKQERKSGEVVMLVFFSILSSASHGSIVPLKR